MRLHAVLGAPYGSRGAGAHSQRYLTQVFWLFPILCCLKKSLPCVAPPQTPSPCPRTSLWTLDSPCGQSQKFLECSGCWGPAGSLPPNPWHLQTWPGAGRTARLSWVPAEEGTSPSPSWRTAKSQCWRQAPPT